MANECCVSCPLDKVAIRSVNERSGVYSTMSVHVMYASKLALCNNISRAVLASHVKSTIKDVAKKDKSC